MAEVFSADGGAGAVRYDPYRNREEATKCLSDFTRDVLGNNVGILWCDDAGCVVMRQPVLGTDGFGLSLVVERLGVITPTSEATNDKQSLVESFKRRCSEIMAAELRFYSKVGQFTLGVGEVALDESRYLSDQYGLTDAANKAYNFLTADRTEHYVSLFFDILGVIPATALEIRALRAAELGVVGLYKAGRYLAATAKATGRLAAVGSAFSAIVDGSYVFISDVLGAPEEAKQVASSPAMRRLSFIGAALTAVDLVPGSVVNLGTIKKLTKETQEMKNLASNALVSADEARREDALIRDSWLDNPGSLEKSVSDSLAAGYRAARFAKAARNAQDIAQLKTHELLLTRSSLFGELVGTPVIIAYQALDLLRDGNPFANSTRGHHDIRPYTDNSTCGDKIPQNLYMRVAAVNRISSEK